MQTPSLLCSSNSLSPSLTLPVSRRFAAAPFRGPPASSLGASSWGPVLVDHLRHYKHILPPVPSTATQEIVETSESESGFVEVGYISNAHGLQGEIAVKPNTDFPELRLSKPGRRWLRQRVLGRETIQEVELVEGRDNPGQKNWIVRFTGIDTVDLAKQLVGSTVLVKEEDRPELLEGEFYSRDLVGMRVILKETGELVGIVVNVFNTGANDLLQVMLDSSRVMPDENGMPRLGTGVSDSIAWVPFVEAIVPIVDMDRREMQITPPKGLLELNLRSDLRSKKERRQLEWKQRKKFQQRLIAAKKKLCAMEQQHVFHGFKFGEKAQGRLLADEIVSVNSKLLELVLQNIEIPSERWELSKFLSANSAKLMRNTLELSEESLTRDGEGNVDSKFKFLQNRPNLMSEGKVAIVLVVNNNEELESQPGLDLLNSESSDISPGPFLQTLLRNDQKFFMLEDRLSVPLIIVCPVHEIQFLKELFLQHNHFSFDSRKVWFLEEEKLPVIGSSEEEKYRHKILMKSPWEILQSPVGSGGVVSLLSSHPVLDNLIEMGVEYIEVHGASQKYVGGRSVLLDFVNSRKADIGIQFFKDSKNFEDNLHMIFSMKFMKKIAKQINKLHFHAVLKMNSHVEQVDKEWISLMPSSANSYELHCSIYSSLNACSSDKVCLLEITR
ncbi:uncharacterized protein LOC131145195 [Malania oleifera]|uniref:uncharacterized protein LOC131145195 n=1 Tax=Malania oleifera TaxID=397392 RepID=UPI0025ADA7B0|nr:uncharacterized protein LOC131145195 [Malania oleifera]